MENKVNFQQGMDLDAEDYNNLQTYVQGTFDDLVGDAITSAARFAGFSVTKSSATAIAIAIGRLYAGNKMYDQTNVTSKDFTTLLPVVGNKIVSVVLNGVEVDTNVTPREFLIDQTTGASQPRPVALTHSRVANIGFDYSDESSSPTAPIITTGYTKVADIVLTPTGVGTITMFTANELDSVDDLSQKTASLFDDVDSILPRINTISDDLARLKALISGLADESLTNSLAQDVAKLKAQAKLPSSYVNYRENDFYDDSNSDTAYSGYAAKVDEGLRFPATATDQHQLQVFNQYNTDVKISTAGLMLPAYTNTIYRIVKGQDGIMSLNQYSNQTLSLVQATMSRMRTRFGAEFEAAANSSFFSGGQFYNILNGKASAFEKDGENFQVYDTGQVNPDGQKILRLSNFWVDQVTTPYWQREVTDISQTGYAWVQTWLQDQSGWCVGIDPKMAGVPASGSLTIGICATVNGQPDMSNILSIVTLNANQVVNEAPLGTWTVPIEPLYLQAGQRYGYFLITQASYSVMVSDIAGNAGGTCFYALDGGVFYPNPSQNIMFDLAFASFTKNQTTIDLQPLSLSGGIASIDILAKTIVPANTYLQYQIQVAGSWIGLDEMSTSALATLPPLVPFRAVMTGTAYLMPAVILSGSVVTISRPATTFKHASTVETLVSPSSTIVIKSTLIDFDATHHTYTAKVKVGATVSSPSVTTDRVIDARTIERTQTFTLGSSTSSYVSEEDGLTDSAARLFHVASVFEIAE